MSSSSSFTDPTGAAYSRKQKSLGLLCTNFLGLYDHANVDSVGLDDAARRLGVERRRIYDIVNVLESVGVLARKAKNCYSWIGLPGIPKTLESLKEEALKGNFGCEGTSFRSEELYDDEDDKPLDHNGDHGVCVQMKPVTENRREKSLSMLTENFVKLFLTTKAETVSLDEAAKLLLGEAHEHNHMKTKVRRLYDIANVLSSLNLIEKTQVSDTRKPAFRWLGWNHKNFIKVAIPPSHNNPCKRGFGLDITNVDLTKRSKLTHPSDKKSAKVQTATDILKEQHVMVHKQSNSSMGYVFGPFSPVGLVKGGKTGDEKGEKQAQDWESLTDLHMPEYHNQGLSELFTHYTEAWRRWYAEISQAGKFM